MKLITIALGGNALGKNPQEQQEHIAKAVPSLVDLVTQGYKIVLTHGNGPQVGMIYNAFALASAYSDKIPSIDLQECTAMSQSYIGYHLQQGIMKELQRLDMPWDVSTLVSRVEVDPKDPSFQRPTKPIGDFYTQEEAEIIMREKTGQIFKEDSGRGWRRVVASPKPIHIVEERSILNLLQHKFILITCGGGGIPVIKDKDNNYQGVSAVIDKDFTASMLADLVKAHYLFILTAVDHVCLNFGTPQQKELKEISAKEAKEYLKAGHFAEGSMLPKIEAALRFVESGPNRKAVITSLGKAKFALSGEVGTIISS